MILKSFGIESSEADPVYTATTNGWLADTDGDGVPDTLPRHATKLKKYLNLDANSK